MTSSLPHALTRFIGRESEIAALVELLHNGESRLITLTGAAGVGKSRLAIEALNRAVAVIPGDIGFVDLTTTSDLLLFLPALTNALGVQLTGDAAPPYDLQRALRDRRVVVLLDGFDRLMSTVPVLAELLRGSPGLTVLATCRSRLHVRGERVMLVTPLPVPSMDPEAPLDDVAANLAVALFLERARDVRSGFALSPENVSTVVRIVQHLDGLPLALELAAARLDLLSPDDLLSHLQQRLPVLASRDRDLPDRLRTMRQAIAWSYDLLDADDQRWFQLIGVFAGGCSITGAAAVSGVPDELTALDALRSLTDKSMLWHDGAATAPGRFRMLQMLREFALQQLATTGEEPSLRQSHAAWCLALAEHAATKRGSGPVDVTSLDLLDAEYANLQAALGWLESTTDSEDQFVRLAAALSWFWLYRGSRSEGRRWLEAAVDQGRASGLRTCGLARALEGAGVLSFTQGDYSRAEAFVTEFLTLSQELDDQWGIPAALNLLGVVARAREEYARAQERFTEALPLFRARDEEGWSALVLLNLGTIAYWMGQLNQAEAIIREGLTIYRQRADAYGIAVALNDLARVAADGGQLSQAIEYFMESLVAWQRVGTPEGLLDWITRVATLGADHGEFALALQLFSAVDRECAVLGYAIEPPDRKRQRRSLEAARLALDEAAVATAWQKGMTQPLAAALADAQCMLEGLTTTSVASEARIKETGGLTPRELDVVRLLVEGHTDRKIADRLFISHRTVMTHVTHILDKLEVESRTAAATLAVRNNLI
jgi:predicted ATPase/DNA-binding CsgD family transcriptional regulator